MKRGLSLFALLMFLGVALLAPLVVGCVTHSGVVADPAPLPPEAEDEDEDEEGEGQGGG